MMDGIPLVINEFLTNVSYVPELLAVILTHNKINWIIIIVIKLMLWRRE